MTTITTTPPPVFLPRFAGNGSPTRLGKARPEIRKRIEILGQLDDRHSILLTAGNRPALLALAKEYQAMGMITMAAGIRAEAEELDE